MTDFTHTRYRELLRALIAGGYCFRLPEEEDPAGSRTVILRHDIDARPASALALALVEQEAGVRSAWFFKVSAEVFDPEVIGLIAGMGHVIGYHYEDLVNSHGDHEKALAGFERNLEQIRKLYPVTLICADGAPLSRYNNLWLWKNNDYQRYGITHEMYLDPDFDVYAYYTDTGRRWNGERFNVRDRVQTTREWPRYHSTRDIIRAVENGTFPAKSVINLHPQRWSDNPLAWTRELVWQNMKNVVKAFLKTRNP